MKRVKYGTNTPIRRTLHRRWHSIIARCTNPNAPSYSVYGGKGIRVCDEWLHDFDRFYAWAISQGFTPELTFDRISSDGDYEPANCHLATPTEQANNMKTNVILEFQGRSQTVSQWARETGLPLDALEMRIRKMKWTTEKALTTPLRGWGPGRPRNS